MVASTGSSSALALFGEAERAAFRPPAKLRVSEWTERNRVLKGRTSRPGPWRNANQPILAPLMDLAVRRSVRELWIRKCAQLGGSEVVRNVVAFLAEQRPCGAIWVLPNKLDGQKQVKKYLHPLFLEEVAALSRLVYRTDDGAPERKWFNLSNLHLANGFDLQLAWGGSAASMASEPRKLAILDEVDKFEQFTGTEASAPDLVRQRLHTFGSTSTLIGVSTPTTADGIVTKEQEACSIQLRFHVPCPHCRTPHELLWDNVRYHNFKDRRDDEGRPLSHAQRADLIVSEGAAWMVCPHCAQTFDDQRRRRAIRDGYWGTRDGAWRLYVDGREEGQQPSGSKVGVVISRLLDLMTDLAEVAAQWVLAADDLSKKIDFFNGWLGEPYRDRTAGATLNTFRRKCVASIAWEPPEPEANFTPGPARRLQPWASRLVMTADTQKDGWYWVVRGYGYGLRSHRVDHGKVATLEELEAVFRRTYAYIDGLLPPRKAEWLGIDSGGGVDGDDESEANRTEQVIQFCRRDPVRRLALKGASKPLTMPLMDTPQEYRPPGEKRPSIKYRLGFVNSGHLRDLLASYIVQRVLDVDEETGEESGEVDQWQLNDVDDPEYNRQMSNVQRVKIRGKAGKVEDRWVRKTDGARKDYHDCEVYNLALALGPAGCDALPTRRQMVAELRRRQENEARREGRRSGSGFRNHDGREFLANHR